MAKIIINGVEIEVSRNHLLPNRLTNQGIEFSLTEIFERLEITCSLIG